VTRLRVTVKVRSGLRDPAVDLNEDASAAVLEALAPARELTEDDLGLPPPWNLGYRGLLIEQLADPDPRLPSVFEYGTDALRGVELSHHVTERLTDERLLAPDGPIGRELPEELAEILPELLREARATPRTPRESVETPPAPCKDSAPTSDLEWWNDGTVGRTEGHQAWNNCYNYGTNVRTDTFACPGRGSGLWLPRETFTADMVHLYAWYDNLYDAPAANNTCLPHGCHLVALAYKPEPYPDFHWWRKNLDGYWTHKPGTEQVTSYDSSGVRITDPRTCNRGRYQTWVGYMAVMPGRLRIL
jgi:hypothetical protein